MDLQKLVKEMGPMSKQQFEEQRQRREAAALAAQGSDTGSLLSKKS
jgi:hypothetical protein